MKDFVANIINFVSSNYSSVISTLALFISICGFVYTFHQNKRYKPNLEVSLEKRFSCSILKPCESYPGTKANCIVRLSIVNKSAFPITIYKIADGENLFCNEVVSHKNKLYRKGNHTYNLSNQIELPLRLDSYDAITGPIFFPNFRLMSKDESFKLYFFTSRGTFTKDVKVIESFATREYIIRVGR